MNQEFLGIERVAAAMRAPVQLYAAAVESIAGEQLGGLTLYGSVVTPGFDTESHRARSVIVLGAMDLNILWKLAQHGPRFGQLGIAAPLIMTPA